MAERKLNTRRTLGGIDMKYTNSKFIRSAIIISRTKDGGCDHECKSNCLFYAKNTCRKPDVTENENVVRISKLFLMFANPEDVLDKII